MEKLKINMDKGNGIVKLIIVGFVGVVGVAIAIAMIKKARKSASGNQLTDNDQVSIAMQLNTAIHPGRNWFTDLWTYADKDEIFMLAKSIKNYKDVAKEYQNLYNVSLSHELQDALGDDFPEFLGLFDTESGKPSIVQAGVGYSKLQGIAVKLFEEMDGVNVSRDLAPYRDAYRLSDSDFKSCISIFNSSNKEDFRTMLNNESSFVFWQNYNEYDEFSSLKQKLLDRYDKLIS